MVHNRGNSGWAVIIAQFPPEQIHRVPLHKFDVVWFLIFGILGKADGENEFYRVLRVFNAESD